MPIAKLVRRAQLGVRRKLRDHLPLKAADLAAPPLATCQPLPLFAPRAISYHSGEGTHTFTFLNRPLVMQGRIDWSTTGLPVRDQLWRMNLHYMEYLESVDDDAFSTLVDGWIDATPASGRGAWRDSWNSYALSLRVVVWMQQLALRAGRLGNMFVRRTGTSLAAQLRFLEDNLETDLGGNHLVKNIKTLIWASAYFSGPEAKRWRTKGLDLLSEELDKQFLADGMHDERSASYHCQALADLLECRHALSEDPLGGRLDAVLHRMAQVTADLAHPDGGPVLFNDAGLAMAYRPAECLDVYVRLLGRRPEPRAVFALHDAGYYGLRGGDTYLVADCGRIAPDDLPAHGHGDVLSFEWSVAGQRIIVDQGVYEYSAGVCRQRARAAASHNTLCFEGADQADFFGGFRCGRRPNVRLLAYVPTGGGFVLEGTHDGFRELPGQPRHVRRFDALPGRLVIEDRIEG